jgi:hypothetical protein
VALWYIGSMRAYVWAIVIGACGSNSEHHGNADASGADACIAVAPTIVYISRAGGTYTMGPTDDSRTNTSSVITSNVMLMPPITVDADWTAVMTCVQSKFAGFNVTITDVDPGTAPHTELVVIDHPQQIGVSNGVLSISPFHCMLVPNAVAFLMWADAGNNPSRCWTAAQTIASSFGLDHEYACPDLMTFLSNCGAFDSKTFTDVDAPCGEYSARACACGGTTQNSFKTLHTNLGTTCI